MAQGTFSAPAGEESGVARGIVTDSLLGLFSVIWLGMLLGLQILLLGLVLLGAPPFDAAMRVQLTRWGAELYLPERELPLYAAGCVLSLFLCRGLFALEQAGSRFASLAPTEDAIRNFYLGTLGTLTFWTLLYHAQERVLQGMPGIKTSLLLALPILVQVAVWFALRGRRAGRTAGSPQVVPLTSALPPAPVRTSWHVLD